MRLPKILVLLGLGFCLTTNAAAQGGGQFPGGSGNATSLQGVPISGSAPGATQCLVYSGISWGPGSCSGSSSFGFNSVTSGTNTTAAMVVGTGGSLGVSGTGTIAATSVPATGITGTPFTKAQSVGTTVYTDAAATFGAFVYNFASATSVSLPVTGSTQCLHVNSAGLVSGTGSDCGAGGGGGPTLQTNGVSIGTQTTLNLINSTVNSIGLTATFSNPGGGSNVKVELTGAYNGNAATATALATPRTIAGSAGFDGTANITLPSKFIVQGTTDAGLTAAQFLGALSTGILKNTTTTGVLSIAVAGDFPTLNQNTTGSAGGLTGCTTSTAGSICYWNGSAWTVLAGNASGTNWLQETSSGVPSWTTPSGSGISGLTSNTIPKATSGTTIGNSLLTDDGTTLTYAGTGGFVLSSATGVGIVITETGAPTGASGVANIWANSTLHWLQMNNANTGALSIVGIATVGTSGNCVKLATNGKDIVDNGSACGSGGSSAFSAITGSTNTTAAMVVGTGASLTVSGSGTINATSVNGNTFPASAGFTSGGIPYFSSTSAVGSSAALTVNVLVKGGGAGAAPSNSLATDNGTTFVYTGTGGLSAPVNTTTGSGAGAWVCAQGTEQGAQASNTFTWECPAAVTSYRVLVPGAAPTNNFSAMVFTTASPSVGTFAKMPQTAILTSDYTNATTTLSNVTGLSFAIDASSNYRLNCKLVYSASATTASLVLSLTGPATPTKVTASAFQTLTAGGSPTFYSQATDGTTFAVNLGATATVTTAADLAATFDAGVVNGVTAGTLQLQAKANGTGTVTIRAGSTCELQ